MTCSSKRAAFLDSVNLTPLPTLRWTPLHPFPPHADFPTCLVGLRLGRISHFFAEPILLCPRSFLPNPWRWNIHQLSIGYPFRVGLRSGLPWVDDPSPGTLRLSGRWILTIFSLLMPASALALRPVVFTVQRSPSAQCSPTNVSIPRLRWIASAPSIFGAACLNW